MDNKTKRVLIVADGSLGQPNYDGIASTIVDTLGTINIPLNYDRGEETIPLAYIETILSVHDVKDKIISGQFDTVIFLSISMVDLADSLVKEKPGLNAIVLTGRKPEGRAYLVPKSSLSGEFLGSIVRFPQH